MTFAYDRLVIDCKLVQFSGTRAARARSARFNRSRKMGQLRAKCPNSKHSKTRTISVFSTKSPSFIDVEGSRILPNRSVYGLTNISGREGRGLGISNYSVVYSIDIKVTLFLKNKQLCKLTWGMR